MKNRNKTFLFRIVWSCAKSRIFWMFFICVLTIIPQFVSIYGLKIVVDLIVIQADVIEILGSIGFLVALEIICSVFNSVYNNFIVPCSNVKIKKHLNDQLFVLFLMFYYFIYTADITIYLFIHLSFLFSGCFLLI